MSANVSPPDSRPPPPPGVVDEQAPTRVLRQFRRVFNAVKSHFQQVEKVAGLGGAQVWALSLISAQPGITVGALAQAMDIHQPTASNLVRALKQQGLVRSSREGDDRRTVHLTAEPAAQAVLTRAPGPLAGVLPDALARLDPDTLARLEVDLAALLQVLATDETAARMLLAQM
jgi:DNA-binding MarR family transcriptional regulator